MFSKIGLKLQTIHNCYSKRILAISILYQVSGEYISEAYFLLLFLSRQSFIPMATRKWWVIVFNLFYLISCYQNDTRSHFFVFLTRTVLRKYNEVIYFIFTVKKLKDYLQKHRVWHDVLSINTCDPFWQWG